MGGTGWSMNNGTNWNGLGQGISTVGNLGAQVWDQAAPANNYGYDKNLAGKTALKGAASGAAIGTQILPGWGTAIGAVVGGGIGLASGSRAQNKAFTQMERAKKLREDSMTAFANQKLVGYDMTGGTEQETLYAMGGKLKQLNSDSVEVQGKSHAQGGVQISPNIEVEDNETIAKDYVFSDYLGFADRHKPIAKQIGKIEKKPLNRERRVSLEILRKKEAALQQEQEAFKQQLGVSEGQEQMQLGGYAHSGNNNLRDYLRRTGYVLPYEKYPGEINPWSNYSLNSGKAFTEPEGVPYRPRF